MSSRLRSQGGNLVQQTTLARGYDPAGVDLTITDNLSQATNSGGMLHEQNDARTYSYKTGPSSAIKNRIVDSARG
jgi:hypothetical protein